MPIIKTENLCYEYSKNTHFSNLAVNNINISIEKGEFIGLIGHTGSGKSTLIQQLNGLLKPTEGKVYFENKDIWSEPSKIRDIRFKVGMVFQYPEHQLFAETVYEDIAFGLKNMGKSSSEIDIQVKDAIQFVGLEEKILNKSPFELSGGEKRRVAIAGVIAMKPKVLILDEPTAGLDPEGRINLLNQIKKYHKENNNIIIFVSHTMEEIASTANRVIVINKGEIVLDGTPIEIFNKSEELYNMGLKIPQVTIIMNKLRKEGYQVNNNVITIDKCVDELFKSIDFKGETYD